MNKTKHILSMSLATSLIVITNLLIGTILFNATDDIINLPGTTSEQRQFISSVYRMASDNSPEYAAQNAVALYNENKRYAQDDIIVAVNAMIKSANNYPDGVFITNVRDALVAAFSSAGINLSTSSASQVSNSSASQATSKTEFSVTDCTPYPAWVAKDCNIRSGADTTYDKAGSLKKFEQVTVTGTASTGWFRITTADGKEAYISNTLLTTEDPTSVSLVTVDEAGTITEHTVEGDNPEAVAQVVEQIKEENEPKEEVHEHSYTSSVTTEPTCSTVGTMTYTCECGDTYTEEIPKVEHTPGEWETTKKATLLSDGEKVQKCTVCGEVIATEVIPANRTILYVVIGACVATAIAIVSLVIYKKKQ